MQVNAEFLYKAHQKKKKVIAMGKSSSRRTWVEPSKGCPRLSSVRGSSRSHNLPEGIDVDPRVNPFHPSLFCLLGPKLLKGPLLHLPLLSSTRGRGEA